MTPRPVRDPVIAAAMFPVGMRGGERPFGFVRTPAGAG